jgi:hypothetical protein
VSLPLRATSAGGTEMDPELRLLFHKLNNQLGIVLAHAELLESKAANDFERARASQVITSVLDALATTKLIRHRTNLVDVTN